RRAVAVVGAFRLETAPRDGQPARPELVTVPAIQAQEHRRPQLAKPRAHGVHVGANAALPAHRPGLGEIERRSEERQPEPRALLPEHADRRDEVRGAAIRLAVLGMEKPLVPDVRRRFRATYYC